MFGLSNAYDALGRRVQISTDSTTNYLIYSGMHVIAEVDGIGVLTRSYSYGTGTDNLLAFTDYTDSETNTYYCITDHQGTIHALTDSTGHILEQYRYDAWGRVSAYDGSGTPISETQIGNRYLWQGREYSWKTGLYYFRARWYCPVTGRWLSKDPIGIAGGLNQYVFCGNNPVNYRDPLGLCEEEDGWFDRYWENYKQFKDEMYGKDLEWTDAISGWGLAGWMVSGTASSYASLAGMMGGEQIKDAMLAGAFSKGGIISKMGAAQNGAQVAGRTTVLQGTLTATRWVTGIASAGAGGYSAGARINAGVRAAVHTSFGY